MPPLYLWEGQGKYTPTDAYGLTPRSSTKDHSLTPQSYVSKCVRMLSLCGIGSPLFLYKETCIILLSWLKPIVALGL